MLTIIPYSPTSLLSTFVPIFSLGLIIGIPIGIISGLTGREVESKLSPNQGIKQSAINSIVSGAFGGLIYLLTLALCFLLFSFRSGNSSEILGMSPVIAFGGLSLGIPILARSRGGAACIQHFVLRLILHHSDYIPWNYARFLDYCTERSLLQQVGGRYEFIHRLLQEHFAAMPFKDMEGDPQRPTP